jgi:hypothetical protein
MKLTLLAAAALGIVTLGRLPEADAECGSPQVGFLPASGETVPPRPTIYVFVPHPGEARVVVEGAAASIEPVSKSEAYEVVRVRVLADDPGHEFDVHLRSAENPDPRSGRSAHYQVGDTPPDRARVIGVARHTHKWTCSYADTIRLELDGTAIAYRFAWRDGSTTVIPADDNVMWPMDEAGVVTKASLGHLDCMGHSIDPEALASPRAFDLYALFADGSELRIGSSVAQLGDRGVRLPAELVDEGHDERPYALVTQVVEQRPPAWRTAALGALGGAVALLGVALVRRRRRRDHTPRQ